MNKDLLLRRLGLALSFMALVISAYLTYIHFTHKVPAGCGAGGSGCQTVQSSSWSMIFGLPVALLGAVGCLVIVVSHAIKGSIGITVGTLLALIGAGFSAYLTYVEIFIIKAICPWCMASASIFILLALTMLLRFFAANTSTE